MARLPRLSVAGELHLVVLRGHSGQPVFLDDTDRKAFLLALRDACGTHGVALHAYALLATEVRLLATPATKDGLGKAMQALGRRYVAGFNRRHGKAGTLWDGRYRAAVIESERYFMPALLGVETSPVEQGLASEATAWPWSSAGHHAGLRRDAVVKAHARYWALGNTPFEREHAYRRALEVGAEAAEARALREASVKNWVLGSETFVAGIIGDTARPLQPRKRGRPRKST